LFGDVLGGDDETEEIFTDMTATLPHTPICFTRNKTRLHALLIDNQAWFCARDLGHLMGFFLDGRLARKLDPDQRQTLWLYRYGEAEQALMLSESGVYALLVYHLTAANRGLREWFDHHVIPALRDRPDHGNVQRPTLGVLDGPGTSLSLLHWRNEPWIRLRDMPSVLLDAPRQRRWNLRSWFTSPST
jgi:prophage antirepressor-like protein